MPYARGEIAEALAPGLNMHTFNAYRQHPEMYRRINKVTTSRRAFEQDFRVAGLGPLVQKSELGTTILDKPLKIGGTNIINYTYALGVAISRELRDDNQYPEILQLAAMLGLSSYWTTELFGHDVYNNAFSTARYTVRDGLALCASNHPIQGTGATVSNLGNTDLSEAGLMAAILAYDTQVNERGMPILLQPRTLLVNPSERMTAKMLLKSAGRTSLITQPGTNNINPLYDEGLTEFSDPWLTDADAWFLLAEPSQLPVEFIWREMPDTRTWDDDSADATFHKIRQRHGQGARDWRGVWGSPGA